MHLAANLHIVLLNRQQLMAAIRLPSCGVRSICLQKRKEVTSGGHAPSSNRLTKEVGDDTNTSPVSLQFTKSFRCSGPTDDPAGNACMALTTLAFSMLIGVITNEGSVNCWRSDGDEGYFACCRARTYLYVPSISHRTSPNCIRTGQHLLCDRLT